MDLPFLLLVLLFSSLVIGFKPIMNNQAIEKLKAHTEHMLDHFLSTKEKMVFVESMISDADVVQRWGHGKRSRGFTVLMFSLTYDLIQEVTKLLFDTSSQTPSILKIIGGLSKGYARRKLKEEFMQEPPYISDIDPESPEGKAVTIYNSTRVQELGAKFDEKYSSVMGSWDNLNQQPWVNGFQTIKLHVQMKVMMLLTFLHLGLNGEMSMPLLK